MPFVDTKLHVWPENLPHEKQGVPVPGTKRPGQTAHYRNGIWGLIGKETPDVLKTINEIFDTGLSVGANEPFLGKRPLISSNPIKYANHYVWESYGQVDQRRRAVGSALTHLFANGELKGGQYDTVGIWSLNRPEWQMLDLAIQTYGKVTVSLYDTLGKDSVEYVLNHSDMSAIFCTADHIPTLLKLKSRAPILKLIVSIDELSPESSKILKEWSAAENVQLMELREIEALGGANMIEPAQTTTETVASICYTSGTTGNPKGAVLTHGNLALAAQSNLYGTPIPEDACILSYLPLAHIYERLCELLAVATGGRIGYYTGDPLRLLEDAQALKPNIFPSVPRVLNRVYHAAMAAGKTPGIKGALFRKALQTKLDNMNATGERTHPIWDRLVFRKIQAVLGGQIKLMSSGSAPISVEVMDFLKVAFPHEVTEGMFIVSSLGRSADLLIGYGLTETCATCNKTWPGGPSSSGTIGPPQPINEVKLIDVPSMGYTSEDKPRPRGELCIRGENCFLGYFKDEQASKESIDEEGWVHTGDVAEIDQYGRFKIIDRLKNMLKLSQGEFVALEKIENVHNVSPLVAQLYVHGDSLQSYVVGVLIPDPVQFASIVSKVSGKAVMATDQEGLVAACSDERVIKETLVTLAKEAKRGGLKGFEFIKRIHISLDPFTVEDGTMTPTLKIRRKDAYQKFKTEIERLYALGEPTSRL